MSATVPVVRIKSTDPKSQGPFVEINASDFDATKQTLWTPDPPPAAQPKAPAAPVAASAPVAPPAAPVAPPPPAAPVAAK